MFWRWMDVLWVFIFTTVSKDDIWYLFFFEFSEPLQEKIKITDSADHFFSKQQLFLQNRWSLFASFLAELKVHFQTGLWSGHLNKTINLQRTLCKVNF